MVIGLLILDIHFPYSRSLKDKRKEISGLKDRFRKKYNVAVAELDFQDTWQRSRLGVVTVNSQPGLVENLLAKIRSEAIGQVEGDILNSEIKFF
jgi:uncharacterized protein